MIANEDSRLDIRPGSRLGIELSAVLRSGHLNVDGVLSAGQFSEPAPINRYSSVTQTGGRLTGSGTINVDNGLVQHAGVIAPGSASAPGVLSIHGDFFQKEAGVIEVRVDETLGSDRIEVTGTASITGALAVSVHKTAPIVNQSFVVLQAGALWGEFSNVTNSLPAFTWTTTIVDNQVTLTTTGIDYSNDVPDFPVAERRLLRGAMGSAIALTQIADRIPEAEAAVAAANAPIGQVPFPSTPAFAIAGLNTMDAQDLGAALVKLLPSVFHAQTASSITTSRLVSGVLSERLGARDGGTGDQPNAIHGAVGAQSAPIILNYLAPNRPADVLPGMPGVLGTVAPLAPMPPVTPFGLFVAGSYLSSGSNATSPYTAGAITAGLDYRVSSNFIMGAAVSYVSDARSASGTKFDSQSVAPTVYGRFSFNQMFVDGYLGYAFSNSTTRRVIPFGNQTLTAEASPRGGQFLAGATAGIKLDAARFGSAGTTPSALSLTPFLGFDLASMNFDSFVERGAGALAIGVASRQFNDARVTAGLELALDLSMAGGTLTPHVRASVTQRVGDLNDSASAAYVMAPDLSFALAGPASQRTYGTFGTGLRFRASDTLSADIAYVANVGNGGLQDSRFMARAQLRF